MICWILLDFTLHKNLKIEVTASTQIASQNPLIRLSRKMVIGFIQAKITVTIQKTKTIVRDNQSNFRYRYFFNLNRQKWHNKSKKFSTICLAIRNKLISIYEHLLYIAYTLHPFSPSQRSNLQIPKNGLEFKVNSLIWKIVWWYFDKKIKIPSTTQKLQKS